MACQQWCCTDASKQCNAAVGAAAVITYTPLVMLRSAMCTAMPLSHNIFHGMIT
jgi:hypothetical protein